MKVREKSPAYDADHREKKQCSIVGGKNVNHDRLKKESCSYNTPQNRAARPHRHSAPG